MEWNGMEWNGMEWNGMMEDFYPPLRKGDAIHIPRMSLVEPS
jgi:hypothetical protein